MVAGKKSPDARYFSFKDQAYWGKERWVYQTPNLRMMPCFRKRSSKWLIALEINSARDISVPWSTKARFPAMHMRGDVIRSGVQVVP